MKNIIYFLLFCIPLPCLSQAGPIEFIGGIDFTYRDYSRPIDDVFDQQVTTVKNKVSSYRVNYRFGVNSVIKLKSNFSLKLGLRVASFGYNLGEELITEKDRTVVDPETNQVIGSIYFRRFGSEYRKSEDKFAFELPIAIRYTFQKSALNPYVELGFSPTIAFLEQVRYVNGEVDYDAKTIDNAGNILAVFSVGSNIKLNDRLVLIVQPTFRYGLINNDSAPVKEHLYNFGLEFGLKKNI